MYNVSVNLHYCPNEYLVVHEQESDVLDPRRTEKNKVQLFTGAAAHLLHNCIFKTHLWPAMSV